MHYTILIGSHRSNSQSTKVGQYIAGALKNLDANNEVEIIDLAHNPLPLRTEQGNPEREPMKQIIQKTQALVVISPERNGMSPAGVKNFFLHATPRELANKPGLLVGVSAGTGGAYPIAELRMSSYKNCQICYIPQHVIVRTVREVLNTPQADPNNHHDIVIRHRIEHSCKLLEAYAKALQKVRDANILDLENFKNGM